MSAKNAPQATATPTVSGMTIIRNAVKFDYPILEAIASILPLCDEVIVVVGRSDDGTRELIDDYRLGKINPFAELSWASKLDPRKIKIIDSQWDPKFKDNGRILAQQTNLAMYYCKSDWCFYIQADEVLHEDGHHKIKSCLQKYHQQRDVQGLLVNYRHFFGSYDYFGDSYQWYRREIRLIRNYLGIVSWKDAQGFRLDGKKLTVKDSQAEMFHYGWVRPPAKLAAKIAYQATLHHGDTFVDPRNAQTVYETSTDPKCLKKFNDSHPKVVNQRIKKINWPFNPQQMVYRQKWIDHKRRIVNWIGKISGWYPGEYQNYRLK